MPILLVLTFAFILYLGGCFGSEQTENANEEEPTSAVVPTPTPEPVVTGDVGEAPVLERFYHTVEEGDRLGSIASKYNVTQDMISRANPDLNPSLLIVGEQLYIPGATRNAETFEEFGPERPDGVTVDYLVQSGDTLGQIAGTWTISLERLQEANPDVDADNLQVGQLLTIPPYGSGLDPANVPSRTTPVPIKREPGEIQYHIVQPGDSISAIAELYSVTINEIVEANGLPDGGNNIQVERELVIPPPPEEPTPEPTSEPEPEPADG